MKRAHRRFPFKIRQLFAPENTPRKLAEINSPADEWHRQTPVPTPAEVFSFFHPFFL